MVTRAIDINVAFRIIVFSRVLNVLGAVDIYGISQSDLMKRKRADQQPSEKLISPK
jgi:hypothetical protein